MNLWLGILISYSIVGAALAGMWAQLAASVPLTAWQRFAGILLYCALWPALIGADIIDALRIERKFRAARRRGQL